MWLHVHIYTLSDASSSICSLLRSLQAQAAQPQAAIDQLVLPMPKWPDKPAGSPGSLQSASGSALVGAPSVTSPTAAGPAAPRMPSVNLLGSDSFAAAAGNGEWWQELY